MNITLITMRGGATLHVLTAVEGTTLEQVAEAAEEAVFQTGEADYARIEVDGSIYAEYEM